MYIACSLLTPTMITEIIPIKNISDPNNPKTQAGDLKAVAGRAAAVLKPPLHRVWQADAPPIPAQQFSPHHARRTSSPARIRFGFLIWGLRAISSVRLRL